MTSEEVVHFWPQRDVVSPCGVNVWRTAYAQGTEDWSKVTCPGCRLEQPMDMRGMPERELAPAVKAHILAERLAEVQEIEDKALGEIRHWTTLLTDALAARSTLSARLSALQAPVVPEEGAETPALQEGAERVSFRMRPGFETEDGHRYTSVPCEVPEIWHRLADEGPDKLWASGPYLIRAYPYGAGARYHVCRDVDGRLTAPAIGDYHTYKAAKEFCKINARGEQVLNWA
jgi:hypothetical protein